MLVFACTFLCGCNSKRTSEVEETTLELKTCAELNGFECDVWEECNGEWLDAADSFRCCASECDGDSEDMQVIDLFEETPENEELGDIYD
jgi:hypothetical protein